MMISKVRGTFGMKSATLIAPENPLDARVEASVDVTSLDTKDAGRDGHLRSADFFDVENHPTMEFVSTGAHMKEGDFFVDGDLIGYRESPCLRSNASRRPASPQRCRKQSAIAC